METEVVPEAFASVLSTGMKDFFHDMSSEGKRQNVAIFVDYDNVYHTLMKKYKHDPDHVDQEKNLFDVLWQRYGQNNVRSFRAYADFEQIRSNLTSLQRKRVQIRHVYANGKKEDHRKNSSDIEMCIDAIEMTYKDDKVQTYVFVTADSDMIPIMSRMMYKGKRVELFYLSSAANPEIKKYAHHAEDLLEVLEVEIKEYDLEAYIPQALTLINDWHARNKSLGNWLGQTYLRKYFIQRLTDLPEQECSDLINLLETYEYIHEIKVKDKQGHDKFSNVVTEKGYTFLERAKTMSVPEAAPTRSERV